jgi:hypothetical protein
LLLGDFSEEKIRWFSSVFSHMAAESGGGPVKLAVVAMVAVVVN